MITPAGSFNHEGGKHDILGWYWLIIAVTELMKHCEQTRNWETGHKGSIHTGKTLKNVTATISFCQVSKLSLSRKQKYRRNFNTREYWGGHIQSPADTRRNYESYHVQRQLPDNS
jgi:hypothetical protein